MYAATDISGQKFGRLMVVERVGTIRGQAAWRCECDCGNTTIVPSHDLKRGSTKSCGCYAAELSRQRLETHGLTKTRIFRTWTSMISRCSNDRCFQAFSSYGGRGISVCDEWKNDFVKFYEWSINNGYSENLTIDRIDNDGNYEPSNCRWASHKVQANNRRITRHLTLMGETKSISEWAELYGIKYNTIWCRLQDGWNDEKAVTAKVRKKELKNYE